MNKIVNKYTNILILLLCTLLCVNIVHGASKKEDNKNSELPKKYKNYQLGSLMINNDSLKLIDQAIKSFTEEIPLKILLPELYAPKIVKAPTVKIEPKKIKQEDETQENIFTHKYNIANDYYYLNSILFLNDKNWSAWINNNKISYLNNNENIQILSINNKQATIIIKNIDIDKNIPNWRINFKKIKNSNFYKNDENIIIDPDKYNLFVTLKSNQTLILKDLKIWEGNYSKYLSEKTLLTNTKNNSEKVEKNTNNDIIGELDTPNATNSSKNTTSSKNEIVDPLENVKKLQSQLELLQGLLNATQ